MRKLLVSICLLNALVVPHVMSAAFAVCFDGKVKIPGSDGYSYTTNKNCRIAPSCSGSTYGSYSNESAARVALSRCQSLVRVK